MINQAVNHMVNAINAIDNRVALVVGSMVLGYLLIPVAIKVSQIALGIFVQVVVKCIELSARVFRWVADSSIVMNIRGLGCRECSGHHRSHI